MSLRYSSLLSFAVLVGVLIGLFFLKSIFAVEPVGITIQVLAVLLMLWARATFGVRSLHAAANPTSGGLVTNGPYRFIRHPIYAAILYFLGVGIASHLSWATFALGLVAIAASSVRIYSEERLIVERYPEYEEYAARTKRVIPFVI
jgi:protein-S-isoprenylcysteine O-methyltransferase Ste14